MKNIKSSMTVRQALIIFAALIFITALILTFVFVSRNAQSNDDASSEPLSEIESHTENTSISDNSNAHEHSDVFNETSTESGASNGDIIFHGWIINNYGYTYVYNNCGYEQFNYKETALNRYVNCLNNISSVFTSETAIYNITVPVGSTFAQIPREIYTSDNFYNQSQSVFVSTVASKLNPLITNISLVTMLEEQYDKGEYVYFRTDKNWTQLGAYYAYTAFCESVNLKPYPLESFIEMESHDFLGSFYSATSREEMKQNKDVLTCYSTIPSVSTVLTIYDSGKVYADYKLCDNSVSISNAYDCFLGRSAGRYEINTNTGNESLLIIGDSSVYPILPFLASHYNKIDLINPEKFHETLSDFLINREYDAVITMCYSTNAVSGDFVPSLNKFAGVNTDE